MNTLNKVYSNGTTYSFSVENHKVYNKLVLSIASGDEVLTVSTVDFKKTAVSSVNDFITLLHSKVEKHLQGMETRLVDENYDFGVHSYNREEYKQVHELVKGDLALLVKHTPFIK